MKYIQRKRKERLVHQWVKQAGLPPEEVTPELLGEKPTKELELGGDDIPGEQLPYYTAMTDIDREMDIRDIPRFEYVEQSVSERLSASLTHLLLLVVFNVVFFMAAYVAFLRSDVR